MNRDERVKCAGETVDICKAGYYTARNGRRVEIKDDIARMVAGTVLYAPPQSPPRSPPDASRHATKIAVTNETTFNALQRMARERKSALGCLNFASARNPGGGFLNGAQAQEESLARASAIYPSLLARPAYYEQNRAQRSALYLDLIIFSPNVPFFRNDWGELLEQPILASVITAPAPNRGAVTENEPANAHLVNPTLRRRAELVLAVAAGHAIQNLVLGAWGCGVFRNEPGFVARTFSELLNGRFAGMFENVAFAVYDQSPGRDIYKAFANVFGGK